MALSASCEPGDDGEEIHEEIEVFPRFDVVSDHRDHFYTDSNLISFGKPDGLDCFDSVSSSVHKKIMKEWRILERHLPDSIFVRVYENRIDLMRAVIIGAAGTPYHDALFFFDIAFPSDYPNRPPYVFYRSFGFRLNPNLYANGRVCLSLINTWDGKKCEKWNPNESTMLQVLLSIQALVLNEQPFFNEPAYGIWPSRALWEKKSMAYNEDAFFLSCKIMILLLRIPPLNFEVFVNGHFRERAHAILSACQAYSSGKVIVGSYTNDGSGSSTIVEDNVSTRFKGWIGKLYPELVAAFSRIGAPVEHFVEQLKLEQKAASDEAEAAKKKKKEKRGFSISKIFRKLKKVFMSPQLGIYKRDFVCYRSGFAPARKKPSGEHHRDRKSVRCGCDAKMYLSKEVVEGVSQWFVVQFSNVHNHELLEDDQVRLLPAYRKIHEADQERILLLSKAGFPIHRIVKVLELEKGIQGGQLPFLERDVRNFVQNRKKIVQENDAILSEKRENDTMELLEVCKATKETDEDFVYDFTVDANDKVENIAWSYGDSVHAYNTYGDVVYFDTAYRSISYGMLFGAWFGVDNNGRPVFLGCVLLQDESPHSFAWALQAFVGFMKGRCPTTILTDLDPVLRDSIRNKLPSTKHVISMWSILPKLSSWFSIPLGSQYAEFRSEFEALYRVESAEDFELQWNQLVSMFGLGSDRHIVLVFSIRTSWALSYVRGYFLARMATPEYSKSVDAFLKGIFTPHTCLRSFFEQVAMSANIQNQSRIEMQYMHTKTCLPIEEHARGILTPFAFSALRHELVLAMQYAASEMADGSYLVRHFKKMEVERLVIWIPEDEQIHCSCKEFESSGILCRHALRIFVVKNYFQLPDRYFLTRWRRENSLVFYEDHTTQGNTEEWFQEFQSLTETLLRESSVSKEQSDYVRQELTKELTRLISEVRDMPESDGVAMDFTLSPTG